MKKNFKMNKSACIIESKSQEKKQIECIIVFMSELNTTTLKDKKLLYILISIVRHGKSKLFVCKHVYLLNNNLKHCVSGV